MGDLGRFWIENVSLSMKMSHHSHPKAKEYLRPYFGDGTDHLRMKMMMMVMMMMMMIYNYHTACLKAFLTMRVAKMRS